MAKTFERVKSVTHYVNGVEDSSQTSVTTFVKKATGEPSFVKLYIQNLGRLKRLQGGTLAVLYEFLRMMNYNNEVTLAAGTKQVLCETLDIYNKTDKGKVLGVNVLDQQILKLVKAGIAARKGKGLLILNPVLFGKGAWADIQSIHLHLTYNKDGTIMYSEISKEEKE